VNLAAGIRLREVGQDNVSADHAGTLRDRDEM
jgi:hypothetical protein